MSTSPSRFAWVALPNLFRNFHEESEIYVRNCSITSDENPPLPFTATNTAPWFFNQTPLERYNEHLESVPCCEIITYYLLVRSPWTETKLFFVCMHMYLYCRLFERSRVKEERTRWRGHSRTDFRTYYNLIGQKLEHQRNRCEHFQLPARAGSTKWKKDAIIKECDEKTQDSTGDVRRQDNNERKARALQKLSRI